MYLFYICSRLQYMERWEGIVCLCGHWMQLNGNVFLCARLAHPWLYMFNAAIVVDMHKSHQTTEPWEMGQRQIGVSPALSQAGGG